MLVVASPLRRQGTVDSGCILGDSWDSLSKKVSAVCLLKFGFISTLTLLWPHPCFTNSRRVSWLLCL